MSGGGTDTAQHHHQNLLEKLGQGRLSSDRPLQRVFHALVLSRHSKWPQRKKQKVTPFPLRRQLRHQVPEPEEFEFEPEHQSSCRRQWLLHYPGR